MEESYPTNHLAHFRKRRKLSQSQVAKLLGFENPTILSRYEKGTAQPSLGRALALEIVYRVPVAFLFPGLYGPMKTEIYAEEERIAQELIPKPSPKSNKRKNNN
jgi:transcriptional regulator with XRE-family HTH domain